MELKREREWVCHVRSASVCEREGTDPCTPWVFPRVHSRRELFWTRDDLHAARIPASKRCWSSLLASSAPICPQPPLTAMFILSTITDTLFIPGSSFSSTSDPSQPATSFASISLAINTKYANKVIPDVGLCVCLFDILEASEGRVKWGDGGLWHSVKARLVVFRPFIGEILVGKVMSSDEKGIRGESAGRSVRSNPNNARLSDR